MSWKVADWFGTNNIDQNFDYNAQLSESPVSNDWTDAGLLGMTTQADTMNATAGTLMNMSNQALEHGNQFMDPNSAWYRKAMGALGEQMGTAASVGQLGANRDMASRGVGGGNMRNLLSAISSGQTGEGIRMAGQDLYQQGVGIGGQFIQQALGGVQGAGGIQGQAGGLLGQVGGLGAQIANMGLQQSMFNAQQQNEQQQFTMTSKYNQAVGNRTNRAGLTNTIVGSLLNPYGSVMESIFGG